MPEKNDKENAEFLAKLAEELEAANKLNVTLTQDLKKANERIEKLEGELSRVPKVGQPPKAEWPKQGGEPVTATPEHSLHAAELQRQKLAKQQG